MRYLELCCIAPHPPIMVREVGGSEVARVRASVKAMETLAGEIEETGPETLVVMSPHTPVRGDAFAVKVAAELSGSLGQFGAPEVRIDSACDLELARALAGAASDRGVAVELVAQGPGHRSADLDHGILVPLYFLARPEYQLLCLSVSFLDYREHYQLGIALREAVESTRRKSVFIASGDMSHRLKPGAPAGFDPRAAEFDLEIVKIVESGRFAELFELDPGLVSLAGECGLRSVFSLAGALDGYAVETDVLSYEGPFGVGYLVASFRPGEPDKGRSLVY